MSIPRPAASLDAGQSFHPNGGFIADENGDGSSGPMGGESGISGFLVRMRA